MKKNITLVSLLILLSLFLVFKYSVFLGICQKLDYVCRSNFNQYEHFLSWVPLVLFFSAATYFLPAVIFKTWWKFARFAIPATFVLVILINLGWHHQTGGFFNMDADFDRLYVAILYFVFTLGSLIQIYRGYRLHKKP